MANYSSLKDFYETFKNELSSDDYEYCEEETKADDSKEVYRKKSNILFSLQFFIAYRIMIRRTRDWNS